MKEEYFDSLDMNFIMSAREIGYAQQNAIIENVESLDTAPSRLSLWERIRGKGNKPSSGDER
jgi:hypothetical protein